MIGWDIFGWVFILILIALIGWHLMDYIYDRRN